VQFECRVSGSLPTKRNLLFAVSWQNPNRQLIDISQEIGQVNRLLLQLSVSLIGSSGHGPAAADAYDEDKTRSGEFSPPFNN
jgi:hypothetical protein